jgi:predicted site-specific integrase-resolvase
LLDFGGFNLETRRKLLKEAEAAEYLRISVYTLREIRKLGRISYIQLTDKSIRYTEDQLDEYQLRHTRKAA